MGTVPAGLEGDCWLAGGGAVPNQLDTGLIIIDQRRSDRPAGNIYNSFSGMWSNAEMFNWKLFARTSFGICAVQSVSRKVLSSLKLPSSKTCKIQFSLKIGLLYRILRTSMNSVPSGSSFVACKECGIPGGKYQRSPVFWKEEIRLNYFWSLIDSTDHYIRKHLTITVHRCHRSATLNIFLLVCE